MEHNDGNTPEHLSTSPPKVSESDDASLSKSTASMKRSSSVSRLSPEKGEESALSTPSSSQSISPIVYFGRERTSGGELWDTSYFLSLLLELADEFQGNTNEESRLAAFTICRFDEITLNSPIPNKLVLHLLKYFKNIRLKILVLLELLSVCEPIDCTQALLLLWEFSNYGYMTLFYVLDRLKFSIVDKDVEWKSLLTIFEPLENKKHAAYIVLDRTNFYKPNRASITFGSKKLQRHF